MQSINEQINHSPDFSCSSLNWALFFGAVLFFMANLFASIATFPSYSLAIGSTPFQAGVQNTAFAISAVGLRIYFGPQMDRNGPKKLMLIGIFTFVASPLLLLSSSSYSMLVAVRIFHSLGLAVVLPGISALVAEMAPAGRIGAYLGSTRIFFNVGMLTGPSAAILLINNYGYGHWFVVSSITSLASLLCLAAVKTPSRLHSMAQISGTWKQMHSALSVKEIYPIIAAIAIFSFSYSAVISFANVYLESASPGAAAAYFFVILGLAGIITCIIAGSLSDRIGRERVAWPMLVILGMGVTVFALLPRWEVLLIVSALLLGVGIQGSSLIFGAWLIDIARPELRSTTISIQENMIDICFALGAITFGLAAQGPGLGSAFMAAGIITMIAVIPLVRLKNNLSRKMP
jgi:predicted MFS family arabinose efflux permease